MSKCKRCEFLERILKSARIGLENANKTIYLIKPNIPYEETILSIQIPTLVTLMNAVENPEIFINPMVDQIFEDLVKEGRR